MIVKRHRSVVRDVDESAHGLDLGAAEVGEGEVVLERTHKLVHLVLAHRLAGLDLKSATEMKGRRWI